MGFLIVTHPEISAHIFSEVTRPWPLDEHNVRVKKHLHGGCFLFVDLISAFIAGGARRGGKHALQYAQTTTMSHGEIISKFPNLIDSACFTWLRHRSDRDELGARGLPKTFILWAHQWNESVSVTWFLTLWHPRCTPCATEAPRTR